MFSYGFAKPGIFRIYCQDNRLSDVIADQALVPMRLKLLIWFIHTCVTWWSR